MAWLDVRQARGAARLSLYALAVSLALHLFTFFSWWGEADKPDEKSPFDLPAEIEFGVTEPELGAESAPAPAPPPAAKAEPKHAAVKKIAQPTSDFVVAAKDAGPPADAGEPGDAGVDAAVSGSEHGSDGGEPATANGDGFVAGADGEGGYGSGGDGTAYAPAGATIALNVDLERVRSTSLLLEARALLGIIPEWELLLQGSGLDPLEDLSRVFVATPNLTRSSLVVAARYTKGRERIQTAVKNLAAEQGAAAAWRKELGFEVAPWRNRGPTERVLALIGDDQLVITRREDLKRVLSVAHSLERARAREGFDKKELAKSGGLLAMQDDEAAAFWVEGVRRYVPNAQAGVPKSLRFSIRRIDQFHTELRANARYGGEAEAKDALSYVDGLRVEWSTHPRVIFLGLKNALETAQLSQDGSALVLRAELTLHQTRYLLAFVSKVLSPRDAPKPP